MRMRENHGVELAVCPYYIQNPSEYRGKWNEILAMVSRFIWSLAAARAVVAQAALKYPDINFVPLT